MRSRWHCLPCSVGDYCERPVVVAVVAMRMMQAPIYEIVDVIAMRHGFVPAIRPVPVLRLVATGVMVRIAAVRILCAHGDDMLIGTAPLTMFEPAMIEIIDVAFMLHGDVPAAWAMDVRRGLMRTVLFGCHGGSFLPTAQSSAGDYAGGGDVERRTSPSDKNAMLGRILRQRLAIIGLVDLSHQLLR
jgi:hypothetical protein